MDSIFKIDKIETMNMIMEFLLLPTIKKRLINWVGSPPYFEVQLYVNKYRPIILISDIKGVVIFSWICKWDKK